MRDETPLMTKQDLRESAEAAGLWVTVMAIPYGWIISAPSLFLLQYVLMGQSSPLHGDLTTWMLVGATALFHFVAALAFNLFWTAWPRRLRCRHGVRAGGQVRTACAQCDAAVEAERRQKQERAAIERGLEDERRKAKLREAASRRRRERKEYGERKNAGETYHVRQPLASQNDPPRREAAEVPKSVKQPILSVRVWGEPNTSAEELPVPTPKPRGTVPSSDKEERQHRSGDGAPEVADESTAAPKKLPTSRILFGRLRKQSVSASVDPAPAASQRPRLPDEVGGHPFAPDHAIPATSLPDAPALGGGPYAVVRPNPSGHLPRCFQPQAFGLRRLRRSHHHPERLRPYPLAAARDEGWRQSLGGP